jgi:hypothetical protein
VLGCALLIGVAGCGEELRCEPGATESREADTPPEFLPHRVTSSLPANFGFGDGSTIRLEFDREIDPNQELHVMGENSGPVAGSIVVDGTAITFTPERSFMAGERVTVQLPRTAVALEGDLLAPHGYAWQFYVSASPSARPLSEESLFEVERHSTEGVPGSFSQTYGGVAVDLDRNGFADLALVNEHSDDVVTFKNASDGSIGMQRLPGSVPTGHGPSPSHAADLDGDGYVDLVVANTRDDVVSLYRGGPDGQLTSWQDLPTGCQPRGVALIDVNSDGFEDLVTADYIDDSISIHVNNGDGTFLVRTILETPNVQGDYAIAAGDIDNDGLMDLVVGGHDDGSIVGFLARGEGHFVRGPSASTPKGLWHVNVADLSGDGIADVAVAGGHSGKGSLIVSTAAGEFGDATIYTTDPGNASTDIGDLDGDGDLDWVLSSFSGVDSDWSFFENVGNGEFRRFLEFDSPQDASCCLLVDFDRDGDLDAALIDERVDVLIMLENR